MYEIWHNTRCSKSRKTLALLLEAGIKPVERFYLENPPTKKELENVLKLLGVKPIAITRTGEAIFKELGLSKTEADSIILDALVDNPSLIERPIVIKDGKEAIIGRPPENVLSLLK